MSLVSGTLYEMDTDAFRLELKNIEDSEEGIVFQDSHLHNTEVTVAGTTFARTIEILAPYSVQFLPNSAWSVRLAGSNNNIFDVENGILVQNQVQVIAQNSGGLISSPQITDVHKLLGLDEANDVTRVKVSPTVTTVTVDDITQTHTESPTDTITTVRS
jgi:hypothetical protein